MSNVKVSELPVYSGSPSGTWFVIDDSTLTTTSRIQLEDFNNGSSGTSGTSGYNGANGTSGTSGTSGVSGSSGSSGTSGISGSNGSSGTSGNNGSSGTSGTSGINGSSGTSGTSGINGTSGTSGTSGLSGSSGTSGTSGDSIFAQTGSFWNTTRNVGITGSFDVNGISDFIGNINVTGSGLFTQPIQVSLQGGIGTQFTDVVVYQGVGTASVAYDQFINGGNFDNLHMESILGSGTVFQDWSNSGNTQSTWLQIPTNPGNNPPPQFKRGLGITGSLSVTGSISTTSQVTSSFDSTFNRVRIGQGFATETTNRNNIFIGSGKSVRGSIDSFQNVFNISLGYSALTSNISGSDNVAVGQNASVSNTNGSRNISIGTSANQQNQTGSNNIAIGWQANYFGTNQENIAIGSSALQNNGSDLANVGRNLAIGGQSLFNVTGSRNIGLGYSAGKYETGSNALYIDAYDRSNFANSVSGSIIYGNMSSTVANQNLRFNAKTTINSTLKLEAQNPLPTGTLGELAVSSSNALYFHNGTSWILIS